jgi:hypothetical protein
VRFVITESDRLNFETCAFMGREVTLCSDGALNIIFLKNVEQFRQIYTLDISCPLMPHGNYT